MPELSLTRDDLLQLADLLRGQSCPPNVRRGTWWRIVNTSDLPVLSMGELQAIATRCPEVVRVLGLPELPP